MTQTVEPYVGWWTEVEPNNDLLDAVNDNEDGVVFFKAYTNYRLKGDVTEIALFLDIRDNGLLRVSPDSVIDKRYDMRYDMEVDGDPDFDSLVTVVKQVVLSTVPVDLAEAVFISAPADPLFIPGKVFPRDWAIENLKNLYSIKTFRASDVAVDSPILSMDWFKNPPVA